MHIHRRFTPFHPVHRLFYFYQSINKDCPSISAAAAKKNQWLQTFRIIRVFTFPNSSSKHKCKIFSGLSAKKKGLTTPVKYVHNIFRVFTGESLSCVKITEIFLISGKGIYNELTGHTATACEEEFVQFVSLRMRALSANIRSVVTCSK